MARNFGAQAPLTGLQLAIDHISSVGVFPRSLFRKLRLVSKWNFFGLFRPTAMVDTLAPQRAVVRSTMVTFAKSSRRWILSAITVRFYHLAVPAKTSGSLHRL